MCLVENHQWWSIESGEAKWYAGTVARATLNFASSESMWTADARSISVTQRSLPRNEASSASAVSGALAKNYSTFLHVFVRPLSQQETPARKNTFYCCGDLGIVPSGNKKDWNKRVSLAVSLFVFEKNLSSSMQHEKQKAHCFSNTNDN